MHLTPKAGLAVLAAMTGLLAPASPAAAATTDLRLSGGTLETSIQDFDLSPGSGTPVCGPHAAGTLEFQVGSGPSGASTVAAVSASSAFSVAGQNYLFDLSLGGGSQAGMVTGTSITQDVSINAKIHKTTAPTGCTAGTLECDVDADLALVGTSSTPPDASGAYSPGTTFSLTGAGPTFVVGGCNAPFASVLSVAFNGDPLTLEA